LAVRYVCICCLFYRFFADLTQTRDYASNRQFVWVANCWTREEEARNRRRFLCQPGKKHLLIVLRVVTHVSNG
jgi:hypothetical protein